MDEHEFRDMFEQRVALSCVFHRLILSSRGICRHAQRMNLAEREAVACQNSLGHQKCTQFTACMSEHARFAIRKMDDSPMTHAQLLKVQLGSLNGIREVSGLDDEDILDLIVHAEGKYKGIDQLPFEVIARAIALVRVRGGKH